MLAYLDTIIGFAAVMLAASLIITMLIQVVSAVFSFRGSALRWGLGQVFANIDRTQVPTIAKNADVVATEILTHGITSDSIFSSIQWLQKILPDPLVKRFQLATAIRPEELVGVLEHWVASGPPPSLKD
jgi:hypothetical protein